MNSPDRPKSTRSSTIRAAKRPSVPAVPPPAKPPVSTDEIAQRAYEIYLARGGEHGRQDEDWAQAERELTARPAPARRPRAVRTPKDPTS